MGFANDDSGNGSGWGHWPWHNGANGIRVTKLNPKGTKGFTISAQLIKSIKYKELRL